MTLKDKLLSELMQEAQQGNHLSYKTLLSEVDVFLQNYLNKKIHNKSQVEDVIQETLLAIHKSRHTYDSSKSFFGWLLAIAHYKINDHLRQHFRQRFQELDDSFVDASFDALEQLIDNEKSQMLFQTLDELDQRQKEIVTLLKLEGLKVSEVAVKLNLSESNVKVIAHRAYLNLEQKLRAKL